MSAEERFSGVEDAVVEELVAYLDGELEPAARREVEWRLSRDGPYRRHLRQLQRSWELLDRLPKADVDASFTQSTVAMIAVRAKDAFEDVQRKAARRRRLLWLIGTAMGALAFLVGYGLVHALAARRDRQLLRDLPVIEKIDEYRYAESVEFLKMLDEEGLFVEDGP